MNHKKKKEPSKKTNKSTGSNMGQNKPRTENTSENKKSNIKKNRQNKPGNKNVVKNGGFIDKNNRHPSTSSIKETTEPSLESQLLCNGKRESLNCNTGNGSARQQANSIGDLKNHFGLLSVHDEKSTILTKKGNILQVLPKSETEVKCFCRNHKHLEPPRILSLEKARSNSTHKKAVPSRTPHTNFWARQDIPFGEVDIEDLNSNKICLDQIMLEEKIKQRQFRLQQFLESSFEKVKFGIKPDKEIIQNPTFIYDLIGKSSLDFNIPSYRIELYTLKEVDFLDRRTIMDYLEIKGSFNKTMLSYKIKSIKQVVNPFLQLHYNLRKSTYFSSKELLLYHGTDIENIDSICTDNFDWRLVSRHKYGWGVSFSSSPYYASHYSDQSGSQKAMFAVKVLVGSEWSGDCDTKVPEWPFDTTTNNDDKVFVKYDDCSFYPAYVIYYTNK